MAVLLAWDAETATGRPRVPNETVAQACRAYPDVFTGLGSVDPRKGEMAVAEVKQIAAAGLRGRQVPPVAAGVRPGRPAYWPIFAACQEHGLIALFHTGTSGIGASQPGGQGIRLDYAQPLRLDPVAAAHPGLTIVAAHFGWPWHMELIAIALHKTNVYIDISGWSPRRIPAEVISELRGRLSGSVPVGQRLPVPDPRTVPGRVRRARPARRNGRQGAARRTPNASSAWLTCATGPGPRGGRCDQGGRAARAARREPGQDSGRAVGGIGSGSTVPPVR